MNEWIYIYGFRMLERMNEYKVSGWMNIGFEWMK